MWFPQQYQIEFILLSNKQVAIIVSSGETSGENCWEKRRLGWSAGCYHSAPNLDKQLENRGMFTDILNWPWPY